MERNPMQASPDDIDIATVGRSITQSVKKLAMVTALAGAASFLVLSMLTPKYTSEARVLIDNEVPESMKPFGPNDRAESQRLDPEAITSQVEVMKSRDLALKVIGDLKLREHGDYNGTGGGIIAGLMGKLGFGPSTDEAPEQRLLNTYYRNLQVFNVKASRVIAVEFRASSPTLAAKAANMLAESYIDWQRAERSRQDQGAGQVIGTEIPKMRQELNEAEIELERFRAQTGQLRTNSMNENGTINSQQLTEINTKLNEARSQRVEAEARAKTIRSMLQTSGQVDASPDVLKSPIIQQLQVQKARIDRQISELSATLLPAHPRMQQLKAEQTGFGRQMRDEASKIVLSLENEAKFAGSREASLKSELDRMMQNTGNASVDFGKLRELESAVKSRREVLEAYEKRFREAKTRKDPTAVPAFAKIISRAQESTTPVFPKTGPLSLLVMAATLFSGLALIITKALWTGSRPASASRPRAPQRETTAAAPQPARMSVNQGVQTPVKSAVADSGEKAPEASRPGPAAVPSLNALSEHLLARASDQPGYRTMIAPEEDGIEAAGEAVELGRRLVAAGKSVVLIDWSVSARSVAGLLPISRSPGIREYLAGEADFDAIAHRIDDGNLHVIAPGRHRTETESPEEIERLHQVFDSLDESFDHVIVTAEHSVARRLFGLLDGGFDAGVLVGRGASRTAQDRSESGFLGFAVPGLDILRYVPASLSGRNGTRAGIAEGAPAAF
jgi:polysaccharide biosynthesis transport protein